MNCRDLQELLSAYADGELGQTQHEFIAGHLAGCPECRAALARFRETGKQLASLQTVPQNVDIREATMAQVKTVPVKRNRRWLRPIFAGALAVIAVFIVTIVATLPGQSLKEMVARSLTNTQKLKTYRFYKTIEVRLPESSEWLTYSYAWVDFAGPDWHTRTRSDTDYQDGVLDHWREGEFIVSDNTVYLWNYTHGLYFSTGTWNILWDQTTSMIQQPKHDFNLLGKIKKMPDEKIDGVICFHYKGTVDMDLWVPEQLVIIERLARENTEKWYQATGDNLTDEEWSKQWAVQSKRSEILLRSKQVEIDYWIGKNDDLLHQFQYFTTSSPQVKENMPLSQDLLETSQLSDFNAEIVINPPLDDQGNLLPDWTIQHAE